MPHEIDWRPTAIEDVRALFEYLAENASLWDAQNVAERILSSADKLAEFPRLYEAAPQYGEACAASAWPGSMCSTKWTTRRKLSASWLSLASGRARGKSDENLK